MMVGFVNARSEAILPIVIGGQTGGWQTIVWDGQYREIDVAESETEPLIGMALLYGYKLQIETIKGGLVKVDALA